MKLPIKDLVTNKSVSVNLEPYLTVFVFSLRHLKLLIKFSKDVYRRAIGVYIGNQIPTLISWHQEHPGTLPIYNGISLKRWGQFRVIEKPWVLVVDNDDILLSANATSIPEPYFKNIVLRMKVPIDFQYETSSEEEEETKKNREMDAKIESDNRRMMELASLVKKNYEDIEDMKNELKAKDKIIEEVTEKLQVLEIKRGKVNLTPFKLLDDRMFLHHQNSFLQGNTNSSTPVPIKKGVLQRFKKSKLKAEFLDYKNLRKSEDLKYLYNY